MPIDAKQILEWKRKAESWDALAAAIGEQASTGTRRRGKKSRWTQAKKDAQSKRMKAYWAGPGFEGLPGEARI